MEIRTILAMTYFGSVLGEATTINKEMVFWSHCSLSNYVHFAATCNFETNLFNINSDLAPEIYYQLYGYATDRGLKVLVDGEGLK